MQLYPPYIRGFQARVILWHVQNSDGLHTHLRQYIKNQVVSNLFYPYLPLKQEENQPSSYSSFSGRDKSAWLTSTSLGFEPFAPDIIPLASI